MAQSKSKPARLPRPLRPGDKVAVVAPASPVDPIALERGLTLLTAWGLQPVLGEAIYLQHGYLAGPDHLRAADLNRFLADPSIAAILCARGGYGSLRILPLIDWAAARRNPKILVGFSDITALHLAFWKEAGWRTFHGPMVEIHDPSGQMHAYNVRNLHAALFGQAFPGVIPWPDASEAPDAPVPLTIVPGRAEGRLLGGNLEVLTRLIGTRWQPDFRGAILVLEDVDEAPYRIDRMLVQLKLAGLLDGVAGILFGHSPTCEKASNDRPSLTLIEILRELLTPLAIPVLYGFPCGHSRYRATLPLGTLARLDSESATLTVLEPATEDAVNG
ncbi:MAG: LD-carboxypeptidase [Limnochordales bacterium]|nr:LD-carboxypeptidase [Limnochordales bacterium]